MQCESIAAKIKKYAVGQGASIYALVCKETGNVRYIGKANKPKDRLKSHMRDARRRNTPLYAWIRKNGEPELVVLAEGCLQWEEAERLAISFARSEGMNILNVADGGDQPKQQDKGHLLILAKTMNEKRPKNIMRAYRRLELGVRLMEKQKGVPYEKGRDAIEKLSRAVDHCRKSGTLSQLDEMLSGIGLGAA
jgi:hypothetical protein